MYSADYTNVHYGLFRFLFLPYLFLVTFFTDLLSNKLITL